MIGNFRIVAGSTAPWLEVLITKDGIVPLYSQAPSFGCKNESSDDPNVLDLSKVTAIQFELFKCGRVPQPVALQGVAEVVQTSETEGTGDTAVTNILNKGLVRYKWHPNDTAGGCCLYYGRFNITFEDGSIFKWPYQLESLSIEVG